MMDYHQTDLSDLIKLLRCDRLITLAREPPEAFSVFSQYFQVQDLHALFPLLNMVTLPQELIHAVTDYVSSTADLRTLHEVNRAFKAIAEPRAFRVVHFTIDAASVQRLNNIHESDALRHFVKEVVLHYVDTEPEKAVMEEPESDDELECFESAEVQAPMGKDDDDDEELSNAGSIEQITTNEALKILRQRSRAPFRLHKFTRLETVHFSFHPRFSEVEDITMMDLVGPWTHFHIQKSVLESFASEPRAATIEHLTLTNVITMDHDTYAAPAFQAVVSSLRCLSISTISSIAPGCLSLIVDSYRHFWSSVIPTRFLVPARSSLMSLSLGGDRYIGYVHLFELNDHQFPRLTSLTLHHFIFSWNEVADFVVKHKATLRRLELRDCAFILREGETIPLDGYWSDIWEQFQAELAVLEELHVNRTDGVSTRSSQPYISRTYGWIFDIVEQRREQEEDADALERFQATVEFRKSNGGTTNKRFTDLQNQVSSIELVRAADAAALAASMASKRAKVAELQTNQLTLSRQLAAPKSSRGRVLLARRDEIDAAKETSEENCGDGDGEKEGEFGEEVSA